jgi:2-keto-4-pentenoate hydratase/2-oxohepta-3-ene-1,7-dioic acid hydratase in catechol pathway
MSRTIIRYADAETTPRWGVQFGRHVAPLAVDAASTGELLSNHWEMLWAIEPENAIVPLERVQVLSPVTQHQQFICQGVNYRSHIAESGLRIGDFPFNTIFTKAPSCITAADASVVRPAHVRYSTTRSSSVWCCARRCRPARRSVLVTCRSGWPG